MKNTVLWPQPSVEWQLFNTVTKFVRAFQTIITIKIQIGVGMVFLVTSV